MILFAAPVRGSFEESHTGGRAMGLDGAMTAATGDVFAMHYNPGGLCDLVEPEAGLYYGRLVKGFDDGGDTSRSFFGWASPSPWGTVGLSYGDTARRMCILKKLCHWDMPGRGGSGFAGAPSPTTCANRPTRTVPREPCWTP
ncbi:MAG: hypothetical protein IPN90_12930 [Elusimicrobia bacterium]|nr:hypothetical protein [Elusimicrobiota bacterium]